MPPPLYLLVGFISLPVVRTLFRLRARGLENLPEGGFVLAANHVSNFDPWPLALPLFPRRYLRFMAKSELFNPVLGPLLKGGGAFRVRRGESDREAIRTAVELVRAGAIVGFANMLLRLWDDESPRAVLVGWDTLSVPTYRPEELAWYQAGRQFD